jgi:MarR family transcriptional regulator for hemolysin
MEKDEKLESVLFYLIEKTNKVVRRYSQEDFSNAGIPITVDQWLVMKKINDVESINQIELANALFKDKASITRILDLLLKKRLVTKDAGADKRSSELKLTSQGKAFIGQILPRVKSHRKKAITGIKETELKTLREALQKIINNMS